MASSDEDAAALAKSDSELGSDDGKVNFETKGMKPLAPDFSPGPKDVICNRGAAAYSHPGNRRFRTLIEMNLTTYSNAKTKTDKSTIVSNIVSSIREASPQGGFIREKSGSWYEVSNHVAREKVGQCFRDALHTTYRSSSKAKKRRLKMQKNIQSGKETESSHLPRVQITSESLSLQPKSGKIQESAEQGFAAAKNQQVEDVTARTVAGVEKCDQEFIQHSHANEDRKISAKPTIDRDRSKGMAETIKKIDTDVGRPTVIAQSIHTTYSVAKKQGTMPLYNTKSNLEKDDRENDGTKALYAASCGKTEPIEQSTPSQSEQAVIINQQVSDTPINIVIPGVEKKDVIELFGARSTKDSSTMKPAFDDNIGIIQMNMDERIPFALPHEMEPRPLRDDAPKQKRVGFEGKVSSKETGEQTKNSSQAEEHLSFPFSRQDIMQPRPLPEHERPLPERERHRSSSSHGEAMEFESKALRKEDEDEARWR